MAIEKRQAISAEGLTKTFRDFWRRPRVRAVDGVSFAVERGEVFGLLGPNGSGKSTTLKMVLGLLFPTRGRLRVLGASPRDVRIKSRIGYLPEESYLYPYLTPEETLDFFGRLFDLGARERRRRTNELIEMIGLTHARHRQVGEFSKGMARRVGLAQALINDPDLVILDEPTSGLDPIGCRQMKDLILTLARRGKTVLLSSHLLADVEDVCDRIAILYNGRLRAGGSLRELLEERTRFSLTLPEPEPGVRDRVVEAVRAAAGLDPEISRPRMDLERFFLGVIEQARSGGESPSGAEAGRAVAEYLEAGPEAEPAEPGAEAGAARRRADVDRKLRALVGDADTRNPDKSGTEP